MTILGLTPSSALTRPARCDIERVIRPNILALRPHRCARDDYSSGIFWTRIKMLSATSSPRPTTPLCNHHRYCAAAQREPLLRRCKARPYPRPRSSSPLRSIPSKHQEQSRIAKLRGLPSPDHVFLGVGSHEVIDLPMRVSASAWRTREDSRLVWSMRAGKRRRGRQGQP